MAIESPMVPGVEFGGGRIGEVRKKILVRDFEKKSGVESDPETDQGPSSKPKRALAFFSPTPLKGRNRSPWVSRATRLRNSAPRRRRLQEELQYLAGLNHVAP
ncbi:hypothetical protein NQ318_018072 [Aromia moschata]|uniref:Uncharacterized protein n=1 Tax=Aromia moschata TaxID=1265417 RepID=A0AAV8ZFX5_9CUCU|nr:hypothetical protein NQ318_018072 [Aromia moschata]